GVKKILGGRRERNRGWAMLQRDQHSAVAPMNFADDPIERAPQTLDTEHPQALGSDRTIDDISYERGMVTPDTDGTSDTGGGIASAGRLEELLGFEGKFDQCVEPGVGGEVEDGFRLFLAQHKGRGMHLPQTLEPMLQDEALG